MSSEPNGTDKDRERTENLEVDGGLSITYDANTDTHHVTVESDTEVPLSVIIVQAIATITQSDPLQLEPLTEYIDPEALERLYNPDQYTSLGQPVVSFSYAGYQITVESPTEVTISP